MSNGADRMVTSAKEGLVYSRGSRLRRITRVFIDVDTQRDFMYPHGADYFPQAGRIAPMVARLFRCARCRGYPVISTTMCLRVNGSVCPPANNGCVEGTNGQKKPAFALLARRASFGPNGNTDLPAGLLRRCQQVIFEKRGPDPFEHPKFDRLLTRMHVGEYVVFGVAIEEAVKYTVLGLLARGRQVRLVIDAAASRDNHQAQMALRLMMAKGARIITAQELAPTMQPRLARKAPSKRLVITPQTPTSKIAARLVVAALSSGGNGNGNGKKSKARNGNGKKSKARGGNGRTGKGSSKRAPAPVARVAADVH